MASMVKVKLFTDVNCECLEKEINGFIKDLPYQGKEIEATSFTAAKASDGAGPMYTMFAYEIRYRASTEEYLET